MMDLIDREKLKEAIKMAVAVPVDCSYDIGYNDMALNAVKIADSMPTVDAQPVKHGEWIVPKNDDEQPYCSVCNWHAYGDLFTDYCPGCGAYMVGD